MSQKMRSPRATGPLKNEAVWWRSRNRLLFLVFFLFSSYANSETLSFATQSKDENLPKVTLVILEPLLIGNSLQRCRTSMKAKIIRHFCEEAQKTDPAIYKTASKLTLDSASAFETKIFKEAFEEYYSKIMKLPVYKTMYEETVAYARASIKEWDSNLIRSHAFVQRYSGFKFNHPVTVYITHPEFRNGHADINTNYTIAFGAPATFKNYFTVYIWHEILHFHMPTDQVSHAVNQLLTDNDLRVELNGGNLDPLQGHAVLIPIMKKNMKAWIEYKKSPTNLNEFVKKIAPAKNPA